MKTDLKQVVKLAALLVVWLLMLLFSHAYVADKLNQKNRQQIQQIDAGNYHFRTGLLSLDQVIESFRSHWQASPVGLVAQTDRPEISVDLAGFILSTDIHQTLKIETGENHAIYQGVFRIEFSNQRQQLYYDSNEIKSNELSNEINLNQLPWTFNDLNDVSKQRPTINWADIGQLDALVIRFYPTQRAPDISITSVEVLQSKPLPTAVKPRFDCGLSQGFTQACSVTNLMRYSDQTTSYQSAIPGLQFGSYLPVPAWVLVVLSWLVMLGLLVGKNTSNGWTVYSLISVVFLSILVLHQNWLVTYANHLNGLLLILMLVLVWWQRRIFYAVHKLALPVWFITAVGVVLLLTLAGYELEFLTALPMYVLWACIQQLMLGPVFSRHLKNYLQTSNVVTACWVGVLFSIIHAPNHVLMWVTLVAGVAWSYAWLKYQNIYANAFSHALLALVFYQVMPDRWLGSARIGVFF